MSRIAILLLLPAFVFVSCRNKSEEVREQPLSLSELLSTPTHADSIVSGKPLPLSVSGGKNFHYDRSPLRQVTTLAKLNNRSPVADTLVLPAAAFDTTFNITPQIIAGKPAVSKVTPPVPVKAGEMRSTDIANEHILCMGLEQGLISAYINTIYEDEKGFMWFAHRNGLTMYDGYYYYNYTTANGLPANYVRGILPDKDGSLWLRTDGGLVNFNGKEFRTWSTANGLLERPTCMLFDDDGKLWLGTENSGFCKFDDNTFYHYTTKGGAKHDRVISLGLDSLGRIYIGYYAANAALFDGKNIYTYREVRSVISTVAVRDRSKQLWVGWYRGVDGVSRFSGDHSSHSYKLNTGFPFVMTSAIFQDHNGDMWFGTNDGGVSVMRNGYFTNYTTNEGLSSNKVFCITEDRNGNIWVGTDGAGINKITSNSFRSIGKEEGLSNFRVVSIAENSHGEILFGTWADGLWIYDGTYFKRPLHDVLTPRIVVGMHEDAAGNLLVNTLGYGVEYLERGKDTMCYSSVSHYAEPGFDPAYSYGQQKDSKGRLWYSCRELGLIMRDGDSTRRYGAAEGMPLSDALAVAVDRNDNVWLTNYNCGISKVDVAGNTVTNYTKREGLPSNGTEMIYAASNGNIFVSSTMGLSIYDGEKFTTLSEQDGLSNNNICSIIEDHQQRIWVATARGLNLLTPDAARKGGYRITNFFNEDGLQSLSFVIYSVLLDTKNTLWWGTTKGVCSLDLDHFEQRAVQPVLHFSGIDLMGAYVDFPSMIDSVRSGKPYYTAAQVDLSAVVADDVVPFTNYTASLTLPYDVDGITFHYAAGGGLAPHKVRYKYMLDGAGAQWSPETTEPFALYSNLSPGTYTFHVVANYDGGEWSDELTYTFTVNPPFWEKWWFRVLEAAAFVLVIVAIFRLRTRQLRQRQKALESTVDERTREIKEQKHIVEEKQKEILDSISYAKRLQEAILATPEEISKALPDNFLFYQPKDIVAGDFYFFETTPTHVFYAACDCTGHGVPGAMVSMVCSNALNRSVREYRLTDPAAVLGQTRDLILETFRTSGSDVKDGMDISLIVVDRATNEIRWAGAHNPLWYSVNGEMHELKADKQPVGLMDELKPFTSHQLTVSSGTIVYLFTDGYPDQFGGPKGKKFKYSSLESLLLKISSLPMAQQNEELKAAFEEWRGNLEQVDDVCVIGIRF